MSLRIPVGARDHVLGPEDAPVTVVEYGDYQCPYCGAAQPQVRKVLAHFGDDIDSCSPFPADRSASDGGDRGGDRGVRGRARAVLGRA
jgi:hypothetical protein